MAKHLTSALIIGRPGPLRDSLTTLLQTVSRIGDVRQADDVLSAMMTRSVDGRLVVILLDLPSLDSEDWATLMTTKGNSQWTRWVALVNNERQREEAVAADVDVALLRGCSAAKLVAVVEDLLPR